jgi:hypothetical protein
MQHAMAAMIKIIVVPVALVVLLAAFMVVALFGSMLGHILGLSGRPEAKQAVHSLAKVEWARGQRWGRYDMERLIDDAWKDTLHATSLLPQGELSDTLDKAASLYKDADREMYRAKSTDAPSVQAKLDEARKYNIRAHELLAESMDTR